MKHYWRTVLVLCGILFAPWAQAESDVQALIKEIQQPEASKHFREIRLTVPADNMPITVVSTYTPDRQVPNVYHLSVDLLGGIVQSKTFLGLAALQDSMDGRNFSRLLALSLEIRNPKKRLLKEISSAPVGSRLSLSITKTFDNPRDPDLSHVSVETFSCKMKEKVAAKTLHAKFSGSAVKMDCEMTRVEIPRFSNAEPSRHATLYYLSDYHFFLPDSWHELDVEL